MKPGAVHCADALWRYLRMTSIAHCVTDEIGWKAVKDPVSWHDFHATVLHLLGINHKQLTFYHNGIERRLTNVHGNVVGEILA